MGIVKDIWDIGRDLFKPAVDKVSISYISDRNKKEILASFANEFRSHDSNTTCLLDYYSWIESPNDWTDGSGRLLTTSHKEIARLWSQSKLVAPYEALLVRYQSNGGEISRLFALGAEYADPSVRMLLMAVMYRHHILGFSPRITAARDLEIATKSLGVSCEMFGSFNDQAAYFLRFPEGTGPYFVRTTDRKFKNASVACHFQLLDSSEPFESWYKMQPLKLTKKQLREVELQCELINEIAKTHKNA